MKKIMLLVAFCLISVGWINAQTIEKFPTDLESFETWENSNANPAGWTVVNGANGNWQRVSTVQSGTLWGGTTSFPGQSGSYAAYIPTSTAGDLDNWLISPKYKLPESAYPVTLKFYYNGIHMGSPNGELEILVSKTDVATGSFTTVETIEVVPAGDGNSMWGYNYAGQAQVKEVSLASYAGEEIYVAFRVKSAKNAAGVVIDDVVMNVAGGPNPVTNLQITDIAPDRATVSWSGSTTKYILTYKNITNNTATVIEEVTGSTKQITGLLSDKNYTVTVQPISNSNPNILGDVVSKNFQSESVPQEDWHELADGIFFTSKNVGFNDPKWRVLDLKDPSVKFATTSSNAAHVGYGGKNETADDWILSPSLKVPEDQELRINFKTLEVAGRNTDVFSVWFVRNISDPSGSTSQLLLPPRPYSKTTLDSIKIDLSEYANEEGRIGIRVETPGYYTSVTIYELVLSTVSCTPVTVVNSRERADDYVVIEWKSLGESFEIQYAAADLFTPSDDAENKQFVTGRTFDTLKNLTPGTKYTAYVRTLCESDATSDWKKFSFRTTKTFSSPYHDNFSDWTTEATPENWETGGWETGNWTIWDMNNDQGTFVGGGSYAHPINFGDSYRKSTGLGKRDQWMVSPKIEINGKNLLSFNVQTLYSSKNFAITVLVSEELDPDKFEVLRDEAVITSPTVNKINIDLSEYEGKSIYIAIRNQSELLSTSHTISAFDISPLPASFMPPTNFKVDSIPNGNIHVSWDMVPGASSYTVAYQTYMFNPDRRGESIYTPKPILTDNTMIRGFSGNNYFMYVKANYDGGNSSPWIGPIYVAIDCGTVIMIPFVETFDSWVTGENIGCWYWFNSNYTIPTDGTRWTSDGRLSTGTYGDQITWKGPSYWPDGKGITANRQGEGRDDAPRYLISPRLKFPNNGVVMSYKLSGTTDQLPYSVMVSTSNEVPPPLSSFTEIYRDTIPAPTSMQCEWYTKQVNIVNKQGNAYANELVYVALQFDAFSGVDGSGNPTWGGFKLDDITFDSLVVGCPYPTQVVHAPDPGSANVNVTWNSTAPEFEYVYNDIPFSPYVTQEGVYKDVTGNGTSATLALTDLVPGKRYYSYIRSICNHGAGVTAWQGPFEFTALCGAPITEFPYEYGFDVWEEQLGPNDDKYNQQGNQISCWTVIGGAGIGSDERMLNGFFGKLRNGVGSSTAASSEASNSVDAKLISGDFMDEWLISPRVQVDEPLWFSFLYRTRSSLNRSIMEKFYVKVSTEPIPTKESFTTIAEVNYKSTSSSEFTTFYGDLSAFVGQKIYIAIHHVTKNNTVHKEKQVGLLIDDFVIRKNICPYAKDISKGNFVNDSIVISWQGTSTDGWKLRWHWEDFNPNSAGTEVLIESGNQYKMGIPQGKNRVIYVASKCNNSENAIAWSGPFVVSNTELINKFPFTDDCNEWSVNPFFMGGWTAINADTSGFGWVPSNGTNPDAYAYGRDYTRGGTVYRNNTYTYETGTEIAWNNWLISPAFDLSGNDVYPIFEFAYDAGASSSLGGEIMKIYVANSQDTNVFKQEGHEVVLLDLVYNGAKWRKLQIDLGDFMAQNPSVLDKNQNVYIAIQQCSRPSNKAFLYIDDIKMIDVGTCHPPTDIKVDTAGPGNVVISWNDNTSGTITDGYNVRYNTWDAYGFDPESPTASYRGTLVNTTANDGGGRYSVTIKSLTKGKEYSYYISPTCGDTERWYGPYTFKTDNDIVTTYPHTDNFSSFKGYAKRDFGTWDVIDGNEDALSFDGGYIGGAATYYAQGTTDTIDEWLMSRSMVMPVFPKMSFKYKTSGNPTQHENFIAMMGLRSEVRNADGTYNFDKFDTLVVYDDVFALTQVTVEYHFEDAVPNLNKYSLDTVIFAIHYYGKVGEDKDNTLVIDDFSLNTLYPCAHVPQNLQIVEGSIGQNAAMVKWDSVSYQQAWDVEYYKDGGSTRDTLKGLTVTSAILTGLQKDYTRYNVRVRAACGDTASGPWTAIKAFETLPSCRPVTSINAMPGIDTALITWKGGLPDQIHGYKFEWGKTGSSDFTTEILQPDETSYVLRNLDPLKKYTVNIYMICELADTSRVSTRAFDTHGECLKVTDLSSTTDKRSATLSWKTVDRATTFYVRYKESDGATWISKDVKSPATTLVLENLEPDTHYDWVIMTECETSNYSQEASSSFTTLPLDLKEVSLSVNDPNFGRVTGAGNYEEDVDVTIEAIANPGYKFIAWTEVIEGVEVNVTTQAKYTFTLKKDVSYKAVFELVCINPDRLQADAANIDSIRLDWNIAAGMVDVKFQVQYKAKGEGEWILMDNILTTSLVLAGLEAGHTYDWRVRTICDAANGKYSDYVPGEEFDVIDDDGIFKLGKEQSQIQASPNPANEYVKIGFDKERRNINWYLLDITGQILKKGHVISGTEFVIDLQGLPSKTYVVRVIDNLGEHTLKVVKQ